MEKYKEGLRNRIVLMLGFSLSSVVLVILASALGSVKAEGSENLASMIRGFQLGIFIALQIMLLAQIIRYIKGLKDDSTLKKLYVEENDERKKLIKDKIGGAGFNFILCGIATATVISGFFNQTVFVTLLGVLVFTVTVKGLLKIYYRNKF